MTSSRHSSGESNEQSVDSSYKTVTTVKTVEDDEEVSDTQLLQKQNIEEKHKRLLRMDTVY